METRKWFRDPILVFNVVFQLILLAIGGTTLVAAQPVRGTAVQSAAVDSWLALQQRDPFPYALPLAAPIRTILDGTYIKVELKETPPVPCKRCPDYLPEGGLWKLSLNKGVFRIYHPYTGWKSLGSFFVTRDPLAEIPGGQMILANDPVCPDVLGLYSYVIEEGKLVLTVVEDPCSSRLRAINFTNLPWLGCQPPNREAAISGHWPVPGGCEQ
ncbi:MAG: hypothetical protein EHM45_03590 [Desulfobacteraceae bacterium]|nr:MAG: hypothetical protein EHM45_03590 [Desulfobacteraceae bacterium]